MMPKNQLHIKELVKFIATNSGPEAVLSFAARRNGMLATCEQLQKTIEKEGSSEQDWLKDECRQASVSYNYFLQQLSQVVSLLKPTQNSEEYFAILGLPADAGRDDIKKRYRKLSLRYHPDTAPEGDSDAPEKFIQITKAYHFLVDGGDLLSTESVAAPTQREWQPLKEQHLRPDRRRNLLILVVGVVAGLLLFSAVASNIYKQHAMLTGLQGSRGDFEPQVTGRKAVTKEKKQLVTLEFAPKTVAKSQRVSLVTRNKKAFADTEGTEVEVTSQPSKASVDSEPSKTHLEQTDPEQNFSVVNVEIKTPRCGIERKAEGEVVTLLADKKIIKRASLKNAGESQVAVGVDDCKQTEERVPQQLKQVDSGILMKGGTDMQPLSLESSDKQKHEPAVKQHDNETNEVTGQQLRIDTFFAEYIDAYTQRNAILFSRFFESNAMENGKPFVFMLPVYLSLFDDTLQVDMDMTMLAWEAIDGGVSTCSRFKIYLLYKDYHEVSGTGAIRFTLKNYNDTFRVSSMDYTFDN